MSDVRRFKLTVFRTLEIAHLALNFIALQYLNISLKVVRYSDVSNVNVVTKITLEEICISEYDQSIEPFKFKLQGKTTTKSISPAENQTPVSHVTGDDTHHYTIEEFRLNGLCNGETSHLTLKQNNFKILLTMNARLTNFNFL